jgi:hypothetical protein
MAFDPKMFRHLKKFAIKCRSRFADLKAMKLFFVSKVLTKVVKLEKWEGKCEYRSETKVINLDFL